MKIKTIIIDDEQNNILNLKHLLSVYCSDIEVLGCADSAKSGYELATIVKPDLVFLDIEMPKEDGFDFLKKFKTNIQFEVIFVTAFNHYAIKAIKFNALDYILKPIDKVELIDSTNKIKQRFKKNSLSRINNEFIQNIKPNFNPTQIALSSADKIQFFEIDEIIHCQGESNYTRFYIKDSPDFLVSKPLSEYENLLEGHGFCRVHKSHLVNLAKIKSFIKNEGGYLKMVNGNSVPVSRRKKEHLFDQLKTINKT